VQAGVTLGLNDLFSVSAPANGDLVVTGNLSVRGNLSGFIGLDFGVSSGNSTLSAVQLDFYNVGSLLKTASFDVTDSASSFIWRDNLAGTPRNKMLLGSTNILSLFNSSGSAGISLDSNIGRINLPAGAGTTNGSGIYFGNNTTATLTAAASGAAIFPGLVTLQSGLSISSGNLNLVSTTPSTSSSTGALTVAGGIGSARDAWINGVRIGKGAGSIVTSNTVIGESALKSNSTGESNSAVGFEALFSNTTGSFNSANGSYSLRANTVGHRNVATGAYTLYSNTDGAYLSAYGVAALKSNTSGDWNAAMGYRALYQNTTGSDNTATGALSLWSNTAGSKNASFGSNAFYSNTTGAFNTALGAYALFGSISGNSNIAIGTDAGRFQANGTTALSRPENSIYIGASSKGFNDNDNNSIVIGYNAIGQGANTTVIGNSATTSTRIFGNLTAGTGTGSQVLTTANAPGLGYVTATNGVINLPSTTAGISANGSPIFSLDASGRVAYASNRPTSITSSTPSSSSITGALTVKGGIGVAMDSYFRACPRLREFL